MAKIQINSFVGMALYEPKVGDELELKEFDATVKVAKEPCCNDCFFDDSVKDMPHDEREKYWQYCGVAKCCKHLISYTFVKVENDGRNQGNNGNRSRDKR